jgi:uncharacterized protein GlcG (DUF336 family)
MLTDKKSLTLAAARRIGAAAEQEASTNNWPMVIAVVDDGGHLIHLARMDGALIASVTVAPEKARCAAEFKRPTKVFEEGLAAGRTALLKLPGVIPIEGGVPLTLPDGQIIGAIGVSGGTPAQDGQVAQAGANELARVIEAVH